MSSPEEMQLISRATSEHQLIRHIESCSRLGVPVKTVIRVAKENIPKDVDSNFLAFVQVSGTEEKLRELIDYVDALETLAGMWNPG